MPAVILTSANLEAWPQFAELGVAFLLAALIGIEREVRQKSAGLRTHTLVGTGAALFMLVSKYGFSDVISPGSVVLDPSRVAAQIVTGIGFLGAGLIFVRRDSVRGLTTAASIWLTAAVGAAAGAGLPLLALATTGAYFIITLLLPPLERRLPRSGTATSMLRVHYPDGRGILRQLLLTATHLGFSVEQVGIADAGGRPSPTADRPHHDASMRMVELTLQVHGKGSVSELAAVLSEIEGVDAVAATDANVPTE